MDDTEHRLFLIAHQIVLDGISVYQIFPSELAVIYKALSAGKPSPLPELSIQCADFAYWQREWLQGEGYETGGLRKQLGMNPRLEWPSDRPRPLVRLSGERSTRSLPERLTRALKELSQREGGTTFMTLLTGLAALLHRYTRQGYR
jgi:hypothetical protein